MDKVPASPLLVRVLESVAFTSRLKMLYIKKSIQNSAIGSIQDNINIEYLTSLKFKIPPKVYQDKMINLLSSIDQKIDVNNRINAELERLAKTIYDYWFVQFDFPNEEGKPYKSSGGAMVYSPELKRDIPDGWEVGSLEKIVLIHDHKRIPLSKQTRDNMRGDFPYYGATSIMDYVNDYIFDGVYILLAEDGSVEDKDGKPVLQYIWGKTWVNNHAHVLEAVKGFSNEILYLTLQNISVVQIMSGSIQKKINQENLKNVQILMPPQKLLLNLSKILEPIYRQKRINCEQIHKLTELRDWLLPLLMNGQVRVE
jgi:type I restriction enzyme S subunit